MKNIIIAFMFLLPISAIAQGGFNKPGEKVDPVEQGKAWSMAYGDVTVTYNNGQPSIRVDFGKEFRNYISDKDAMAAMADISALRFNNVADAMNTLSAYGFQVINSYQVETRVGVETHFVVGKKVSKMRAPRPSTGGTKDNPASGKGSKGRK